MPYRPWSLMRAGTATLDHISSSSFSVFVFFLDVTLALVCVSRDVAAIANLGLSWPTRHPTHEATEMGFCILIHSESSPRVIVNPSQVGGVAVADGIALMSPLVIEESNLQPQPIRGVRLRSSR